MYMKYLILLLITLITLTNVSYASFPVSFSYNDPGEEIWEILGGVLQLILVLSGIYYFYKSYPNTLNPFVKFLKLFGIIILSLFLLLGILCGISGNCQ